MTHRTRSSRASRVARIVAAALLAAGLTACGGSDDSAPESGAADTAEAVPDQAGGYGPAPAPGSTAEQEAESVTATLVDFAVELDEDSFSAGTHEFTVVNDGGSTHDLVVERDGETVAAVEAMDPGGSTTLTVALEPGEYVLYCSIANHRAMGMETTIRVT
ncbi:cupredoxin domain-containing protein [Blastococcus tunisiensis]|uniref:Uncharacterized copper-binding protein, cupredoxin-like subfamily n=1 Tax=Blastococcus tunisiensis TaxID=1798228 RepID=A0A1I2BJR7_9ACTN|nr:cupredoxin domain-containing protein [Blastococcus sp. DSM 46838]SFE56405.1 Uncharacterized copper-binding protein, cupredoxin-like subfamily [Blastococcus sp. DSM 46838]